MASVLKRNNEKCVSLSHIRNKKISVASNDFIGVIMAFTDHHWFIKCKQTAVLKEKYSILDWHSMNYGK